MDILEKNTTLNELFSQYKNLLTDKQVEYFEMYYQLDYSFQEIADNFNVSRNAIFDALKKLEDILVTYENKLHLVENKNKRIKLIEQFEKTNDSSYLDELKGMDE